MNFKSLGLIPNKTRMQIEAVVRRFFEFEQIAEASAFGAGHINDTFKVVLEQKGGLSTYLVQRLNHEVFRQPEAVMHNICLVSEHLSRQAYPLANLSPIPLRSGGWLHRDEQGNYWRAFPFPVPPATRRL